MARRCWVVLFAVVLVVAASPPRAEARPATVRGAERVFLRRGPGLEFQAFATVERGEGVEVEEVSSEWALVRTPGGHHGYMSGVYLVYEDGARVVDGPAPASAPVAGTPVPRELTELRERNEVLLEEVESLRQQLEAQSALAAPAEEDLVALRAEVRRLADTTDALRSRLDSRGSPSTSASLSDEGLWSTPTVALMSVLALFVGWGLWRRAVAPRGAQQTDPNPLLTVLVIAAAYLVGSIPTGISIGARAGVDVRAAGSGNVGATNVARTAGWRLGVLTLLADVAKGMLPMFAADGFGLRGWSLATVAVAVVSGHVFPFFGRLAGGKGVATALGAVLVLAPDVAFGLIAVFAVAVRITRIVSAASLCAVAVLPLGLWQFGYDVGAVIAAVVLAALIFFRGDSPHGRAVVCRCFSVPWGQSPSQTIDRLRRSAQLPMPEVGIYQSPEVNAFATGPSKSRSLVAVSTGLLQQMDRSEVEGVLSHEVSHIANGDMVTMTLIQGVVNAFVMFLARVVAFAVAQAMRGRDQEGEGFSYGIYFIVRIVFEIVFMIAGSIVVAWFSRYREFRADAGGARLGGQENMVRALEALQRRSEQVDPRAQPALQTLKISGRRGFGQLFSTHPPLEERIRRLRSGAV